MSVMRVGLIVCLLGLVGTVWAAEGWLGKLWPFGQEHSVVASSTTVSQTAAEPAPVEVKPDTTVVGKPLDIQPSDRVEGAMAAPVTMIEYASLSCPHCADFTTETMPKVRHDWIETGKVKYVLRDLPWDNLALGMAKVARCAPADKFQPLVRAFFAGQKDIMLSNDPLSRINKIAADVAGMNADTVEACIKDVKLHAQVLGSKEIAMQKLGVKGTPTIFVNGTEVDGAVDYDTLKKTLDAAYAKATGKK